MSVKVREWLRRMDLLHLTNHDDRVAIDREIESWTGIYCDDAIDKRLINENEFKKIVRLILERKKKRKETAPMVA
jgi:homospermidine synthase